ncbi:tryptophan 7-halogenase [Paraglaciecola aquimarina]|uniref:Tryptophan 7-halogenase n=1 Tax=Paraglaciecola algarum TaxID=3050085 RepID=A0ABS9D1E2_9ALTE|nr:tryptophan halogenase family protein [Paraglaciecola sp. G1-23]MCF2946739.1 tryptophan 7-halogenase [Paraglaciecola sp. G1-23]
MQQSKKQKIVIAGGGTAGWIAAAAIAKQLGRVVDVELVESDQIGTIAVGEATIPPMRTFHHLLGIDEQEFMRETSATFKLGISFENWKDQNQDYIHSFGKTGQESFFADFHHFWLRGLQEGHTADFSEYSLELQAAKAGKFVKSKNPEINYAYHLDATAYAKFLRKYSEERGIKRTEGKISKVNKDMKTGNITSLELGSGKTITGDFFIDCTGFKGLLIEQSLHTGYEDWSHWLPCDSAYVVQTKSTGEVLPYTRSIAHQAGWRWNIPLQHRMGNGLVYCSQYLGHDEAKKLLVDSIEGEMITEPRLINFRTGRRLKAWNKNCVALGLSSGFIEPLESTSIHLITTGIIRFIRMFPQAGIIDSTVDEFNRQTKLEIEQLRDFIVLHYNVTNRQDSAFWNHCKNMQIPETLAHRIDLFKQNAQAMQIDGEMFRVDSWTQVMFGQGVIPESYHPIVHAMSAKELSAFLTNYRKQIQQVVEKLPTHQAFIDQYCKIPSK